QERQKASWCRHLGSSTPGQHKLISRCVPLLKLACPQLLGWFQGFQTQLPFDDGMRWSHPDNDETSSITSILNANFVATLHSGLYFAKPRTLLTKIERLAHNRKRITGDVNTADANEQDRTDSLVGPTLHQCYESSHLGACTSYQH